ncbi:MAG: hypothetical protein HYZ72_20960 [Deltaproteobacteria bacterium]|nr:hypothetical protein [Deltaproteobacteria bacterium]
MRRLVPLYALLVLFVGFSAPQLSEAASIADLLAQARQAQGRVREIKSRGWGMDERQQAIQALGPIVLSFVGASDLAQSVANPAQRPLVRDLYEALSEPLEDIYNGSLSRLNSLSKAVMDQDGDLEALYETREWKDAQLLASQSLYFLNWLHYVGSFVFEETKKKKLLDEASKGFSEFAVGEQSSQLKRESLFGRALCEKELRQSDWAVRDFELLLKDEGLPADMQRKVRLALTEAHAQAGNTKALAASSRLGGDASPDEVARSKYLRAQGLFNASEKEKGPVREQHRKEAIALIEELRQMGGEWKDRAEALAQAEMSEQEAAALAEEKNPFPQWQQAKEYLQKSQFAQAVPFLREVVASSDPRATAHQREARYFLGVGLFQQKEYSESAAQLFDFLDADGVPPKYGSEAAYLRFKAAEALYARAQTEDNSKLYLSATKDFINRYPGHKSIFEAYFRLGEYNQGHQNYLPAVESYQKVTGDPAFRMRADFATLQCYFSLLDALEEKRDGVGIGEKDLRQRIAPSLQAFWKNSADLEKSNPAVAKQVPLQEYRGKVSVMNAVFLSKEADTKAVEIVALLQDFEKKYPEQKDAFAKVARMRLVALEKAGRFGDMEKEVERILTHFKPDEQKELLAGLTQVLPKDIKKLEKQNDKDNALAAKRTLARLYADRLQRGEAFAEDESPAQFKYELAQLYLDVKDYDKAGPIYQELQQGAYSLVSLAGLAQIAAVKGDQHQAMTYWEEMLKGTQVGDPLWFRGTFEVAQLQASLGNTDLACKTVSGARSMLGRLGEQGLKKKIQDLAVQSCGK